MPRRWLVVLAVFPALLSCKKGAPQEVEATPDAGDTSAVVAPTPTPSVSPAPSAAPTASVVSLAEALGNTSGTTHSWSGWYKCKQKLQLTHSETTITGRANAAPDDVSLTCTVSGDTCVGTESTIHRAKGKSAAPTTKTRKLTLRRERSGTLQYTAEGNVQSCPKL